MYKRPDAGRVEDDKRSHQHHIQHHTKRHIRVSLFRGLLAQEEIEKNIDMIRLNNTLKPIKKTFISATFIGNFYLGNSRDRLRG